MSSKRFAGGVIWSCGALGFNETCFGFSVFAGGVLQSRDPLNLPKKRERRALFLIMQWKAAGATVISIFFFGAITSISRSASSVRRCSMTLV